MYFEKDFKMKELEEISIEFQGKELYLNCIKMKDKYREEVLPGVHVTFHKSKTLLWFEIKQKKYKLDTLNAFVNSMCKKCKVTVKIEADNKRDSIRIIKHQDIEFIPLYSFTRSEEKDVKIIKDEKINEGNNPYFPTDYLPYPDSLGHGGCCLKDIFSSLGLISHISHSEIDRYEFFSLDEILEMTSGSERAKKLCEGSNTRCRLATKKLLKGTYKALYEGGTGDDDITVYYDEETGTYEAGEGKHRVCAAKRFGIKTIPVVLKINSATKDWIKAELEEDNISRSQSISSYEEIVNDFYNKCKKIGLNHDQALGMLKSNDIIQYIEDETGEDITAIEKRINDETSN